MSPADLTPYDKNPRNISDDAVNELAKSIREYGFLSPIIVDKDYVILAGHTRLRASISLGLQRVPVLVAPNLTPIQAKAYRLADNRVAEYSGWNMEMLGGEIKDLCAADVTTLPGFNSDELATLAAVGAGSFDDSDDVDTSPTADENAETDEVSVTFWLPRNKARLLKAKIAEMINASRADDE